MDLASIQETCDMSDDSSNNLSAYLLQEFNNENELETSTNNTNNSSPHHTFKRVKYNNENTLTPTLTEINQSVHTPFRVAMSAPNSNNTSENGEPSPKDNTEHAAEQMDDLRNNAQRAIDIMCNMSCEEFYILHNRCKKKLLCMCYRMVKDAFFRPCRDTL